MRKTNGTDEVIYFYLYLFIFYFLLEKLTFHLSLSLRSFFLFINYYIFNSLY
jgi:hypothetical protein